jgi:small subunit ribosomal protein S20
MPVLKHAKKKLRQDKGRTAANKRTKSTYKELVKKAKAAPSKEALSAAFKAIDKAAKNNILHDNKAARLKSALSKVVAGDKKVESPAEKSKPTTKKTTPKKAVAKKPAK